MKTGLRDTEVLRDLSGGRLVLAGNRDHITTELQGERFRHNDHPSSEDESSQARSQPSWGRSQLTAFVAYDNRLLAAAEAAGIEPIRPSAASPG